MACTPILQEYNEYYGAGFIDVSETKWLTEHDTLYPFTVPYGEITCGLPHADLGRQVYFMPKGFTDESYIGAPLNQAAVESLKKDSMLPNVPYSIKQGSDLSTAIEAGLKVVI